MAEIRERLKPKRFLWIGLGLLILVALLWGYETVRYQNKTVLISGIVVDELTGKFLPDIFVELKIWENDFAKDALPQELVKTNAEGYFSFVVESGNRYDIATLNPGKREYGGLSSLNKVKKDWRNLVVPHNPRARSNNDILPGVTIDRSGGTKYFTNSTCKWRTLPPGDPALGTQRKLECSPTDSFESFTKP